MPPWNIQLQTRHRLTRPRAARQAHSIPFHVPRGSPMTLPRRLLVAMTALTALLAAGCDSRPATLAIGVLVAQTGPHGSRGKDLLDGALLAAEEVNAAGFMVDG